MITLSDDGGSTQNLLLVGSEDGWESLVLFKGKSMPGIIRVLKQTRETRAVDLDYDRAVVTTWTVELYEYVSVHPISKDRETGRWLNAETWPAAVTELREKLKIAPLSCSTIEQFILGNWPDIVRALDHEARNAALAHLKT